MGNVIDARGKWKVPSLSQRRIGREWRLHDIEGAGAYWDSLGEVSGIAEATGA